MTGSSWNDICTSALGRFVQADTLIPQPSDPQSWDRYAYVENNPLRYTDPSGHMVDDGGYEGAHWDRCEHFSLHKTITLVLGLTGLENNDLEKGMDWLSAGLDGMGLLIDSLVAMGDVTAATIGASAGVVISAPGGETTVVVTGPAGAAIGVGLFELNPGVRCAAGIGNALASFATGATIVSDLSSGQTDLEFDLRKTGNKIYIDAKIVLGRDSLVSSGLTVAGWASPIGLTSVPLQTMAFVNDLGALFPPDLRAEIVFQTSAFMEIGNTK